MTDKEKKIIFTIVGVMLVILIIVVCIKGFGGNGENTNNVTNGTNINNVAQNSENYVTQISDGTKINNSSDFNKTRTYKELEISNIQYTSKNGSTSFIADVKNNGSARHEEEQVTISILGGNLETITSFTATIRAIEPGETTQINAIITSDVANARDFKIDAK